MALGVPLAFLPRRNIILVVCRSGYDTSAMGLSRTSALPRLRARRLMSIFSARSAVGLLSPPGVVNREEAPVLYVKSIRTLALKARAPKWFKRSSDGDGSRYTVWS